MALIWEYRIPQPREHSRLAVVAMKLLTLIYPVVNSLL